MQIHKKCCAMKVNQHVVKCNWQCMSLFQREYIDDMQASGLVLRLNVTGILSLRQGIMQEAHAY